MILGTKTKNNAAATTPPCLQKKVNETTASNACNDTSESKNESNSDRDSDAPLASLKKTKTDKQALEPSPVASARNDMSESNVATIASLNSLETAPLCELITKPTENDIAAVSLNSDSRNNSDSDVPLASLKKTNSGNREPKVGAWFKKWIIKYQELAKFYKKHGHLKVKQNGSLSCWMMTQQRRRKGAKGLAPLTNKQIQLLDEIGFDWNPKVPGIGQTMSFWMTRRCQIKKERQKTWDHPRPLAQVQPPFVFVAKPAWINLEIDIVTF